MQPTYTLYRLCVGADNQTGQLDLATIQAVTAEHFPDGFSVLQGRGCWLGGHEDCAVVEVALDATLEAQARAFALAEALRVSCRQNTVLLQALPLALAFVSAPAATAVA